jgi:hypothetical protein
LRKIVTQQKGRTGMETGAAVVLVIWIVGLMLLLVVSIIAIITLLRLFSYLGDAPYRHQELLDSIGRLTAHAELLGQATGARGANTFDARRAPPAPRV